MQAKLQSRDMQKVIEVDLPESNPPPQVVMHGLRCYILYASMESKAFYKETTFLYLPEGMTRNKGE